MLLVYPPFIRDNTFQLHRVPNVLLFILHFTCYMNTNNPPERWSGESAYWPADPTSGAQVLQLTGDVAIATNIYCEDPACSPGNRIAVVRSLRCDAYAPAELWVVDVERARTIQVDCNMRWPGACAQAYGDFFYYPRFFDNHWELRRLSFSTLVVETVRNYPNTVEPYGALGSVSPDGRYLVTSRRQSDGNHNIFVLDIETDCQQTIAQGPDFYNPHPRFDRQQGEWVLVQHNRGYRLEHGVMRCVDPHVGVTLVLCKRDGTEQRVLPIARPFIPQGISGHEAWLNNQPAFVYSTSPAHPPYDDGERCGNLLMYRLGDEKPVVLADAPDLYFGHVSTSACGRYWCCDAWNWPHDGEDCCRCAPRIFVGSVATRRFAVVCDVGGVWPRYENGHAHPYLSSDNRYAIFTSTRTGLPQVFRAELPVGFLEQLDT